MNDKEIMEGILMTTKGVVDLYMHGTVESATPNVHGTFAWPTAAGIPASRPRSRSSTPSSSVTRGSRKKEGFPPGLRSRRAFDTQGESEERGRRAPFPRSITAKTGAF